LKPGAYEELQRQKISILNAQQEAAQISATNQKTKTHADSQSQSDSGNESLEVQSRISCVSDIASD
jgi:ABC-type phosphate transport system auxiliary subunit